MHARSDRELSSLQGGDDRTVAWELHVELATRVSAVPLSPDEGLLGEALASLGVLASGCREILREHGAHHLGGVPCPVVRLTGEAARVLDGLLGRWQPRIAILAASGPPGIDPVEQERDWPEAAALRADLASARTRLRDVAERLAEHAGARSLLEGSLA